MGNYNADPQYSIIESVDITRWKHFIPEARVLFDQWSLNSANRVSSYHDGTNKIKVHCLYDPRNLL